MDIAQIYSKFVGPLPSTAEKYVASINDHLPYIVDTTILLNVNPMLNQRMKKSSTSLFGLSGLPFPQNVLAVGLANCVYLWNACTSKVTKLCDIRDDESVCSVSWTLRGTHLAIGTSSGNVEIWDALRCRRIRTMEGLRLRVGALAWSSSVLSSGSRDKSILQRDIRCQEDHVSKLTGHKSEVCGLKWSYDNRELASGGNDNKLFVWNQHSTQPVLRYCEHTAAFKAIAWSPHLHGFLASGGVTAYRCIRFWNTTTNTHLNCVETSSQVCNLAWSKNVNELVNTHGYSQNIIVVWKYLTMTKTIVTGAGDETLRFWNIFPSPKSQDKDESSKSIQKGLHVVSFSIGSSVEFVYCDQMNDKPEHGSREPADYEEEEELYLEPAINLRLSDLAYTQFVFF